MKYKFISKTSKSKTNKNNFITLDIETYIKNNILTPFCVSIYDGKKISNFYLTNYKNVDELIITALKSIRYPILKLLMNELSTFVFKFFSDQEFSQSKSIYFFLLIYLSLVLENVGWNTTKCFAKKRFPL